MHICIVGIQKASKLELSIPKCFH